MENESKSLIIAGAILLSILIISVGILIYNNSVGASKDDIASEALEMQLMQFNKQYEMYEGIQNSKRGSRQKISGSFSICGIIGDGQYDSFFKRT